MATLINERVSTIHERMALLLTENRRLRELKSRYQRNLKNQSSEEILHSQAEQIRQCEQRIARLYGRLPSSR